MIGCRNSQMVFQAAIEAGYLSAKPGTEKYAGNWMYMGDDEQGKALFKNIIDRSYMQPLDLVVQQ